MFMLRSTNLLFPPCLHTFLHVCSSWLQAIALVDNILFTIRPIRPSPVSSLHNNNTTLFTNVRAERAAFKLLPSHTSCSQSTTLPLPSTPKTSRIHNSSLRCRQTKILRKQRLLLVPKLKPSCRMSSYLVAEA